MGSGYIQLITNNSNENKILNYNPNITFFKIYYRRYANFFINNFEIENNTINKETNLVSFNIPKNGDYLSKSYLKINTEDNYYEIFEEYQNLYSSLNIDLLNYFDIFYIKINEFNITDIKVIRNLKLNFYENNIKKNIKLKILITDIENDNFIINLLHQNNITLESDEFNIFYNINKFYDFYSFNIYNISNILNDKVFTYYFNKININNINNIVINFNTKFSFNITINDKDILLKILEIIIQNINYIKLIKIEKKSLFFSLRIDNSEIIINEIIILISTNVDAINTQIINNKLIKKNIKINKNITSFLLDIIKNNNSKIIYFNYIYSTISNLELYILQNSYFLGNLTNNDFNNHLIELDNTLLDINNINNQKISLNLNINIITSLICNKDISIQNYLSIVDNIDSYQYLLKKYNDDIDSFVNKILDIIINPDIFLINNENFISFIMQNNTQSNFIKYNHPFTNNIISQLTSSVLNYYLFNNLIVKNNNIFYNNQSNNELILFEVLNYINLISIDIFSAKITLSDNYNYFINNNLFDINNNYITGNYLSIVNNINNYENFVKIIFQNMINNSLFVFISESIYLLNNIDNKISREIYQPNGITTNIINHKNAYSVLPLSSNLFTFSNNTLSNIELYLILYNNTLTNYLENVKNHIIDNIMQQIEINNININYTYNLNYLKNIYTDNLEFTNIIKNYYLNLNKYNNDYLYNNINNFLNTNININYNNIYSSLNNFQNFNLNNFINSLIFKYVNLNLFNNTFDNYSIINNNISSKFIFSINSPIYRIYYLFTFLCFFYNDPLLINSENIQDINILRNLTLGFLFYYFELVIPDNDILNIKEVLKNFFQFNFKFEIFTREYFDLINTFFIFDNINYKNNIDYILNKDKIDYSNYQNNLFIYNNFYFQKNKISSLNLIYLLNNLNSNYDDKIIDIFLLTINENKDYFVNFKNIINFVTNLFSKNNFDFNRIISLFNEIIKDDIITNELIILFKNPYYYNSYYTIYSLGTLFDNINHNNRDTINSIYNLTKYYNDQYQFFYTGYNDINKHTNFLNNNNIINSFKYFNINYELFYIKLKDIRYYDDYLRKIENYINIYFHYIIIYIISEFTLIDCINIINKYINLFNSYNNFNIITINIERIKNFNSLILYSYFFYYIENCMFVDYNLYIKDNNNTTFNIFLSNKYKNNIYISCIDDILYKLQSKSVIITLDYFNFYKFSNINNYENNFNSLTKFININILQNIVDKNTFNYKIIYNYLNNNNNTIINYNLNLNTYFTFYKSYNHKINFLTTTFNKINFQLLNESLYNNLVNINENNSSLNNNYGNILVNNYIHSYELLINIYENLYKNSIDENIFVNNIIYIFNLFTKANNYYLTLYNYPSNSYINESNLGNFKQLSKIDNNNLSIFFTNYINQIIYSSIFYEKEINRILYIFCNDYVINLKSNNFQDILKKYTLYDIVKVIKKKDNLFNFKYDANTSLYQNIDVFELFNYSNFDQSNSYIQNKWMLKILEILTEDINDPNSYYKIYEKFYKYSIENFVNIKNFILKDGTPVIDYFLDLNNYEEFIQKIFNFICNYENFSPTAIYDNIIEIKKNNNNINAYLDINTDNIKKKIIIYLFINYVIFYFIPEFLIEDLNLIINSDITLEYTIDDDIITFKLSDVFINNDNFETLKLIIYKVFDLNDFNDNFITQNLYYNQEINYVIKYIIENTSYNYYYKYFYLKFIDSFNHIIGNDEILSNTTVFDNYNPTISNILNKINSIYNICYSDKNFELIINTIKILDINLDNNIFDLNNTFYNKIYSKSDYIYIKKIKFDRTNVSDFNLIYNLLYLQLNTYNIFYENFYKNFNTILSNLRLAKNSVNQVLENLKGYTSNVSIASNFISTNEFDNIFNKLFNVGYISNLINIHNNFSIVTPNDFDNEINFINFNNIYTNVMKKYYNYNYNYYYFKENYVNIFPKIYSYFVDILKNYKVLNNIRNYNIKYYIKTFFDIFNSYIGNVYIQNNIQKKDNYINICVELLKIYFDYNYKFTINLVDNYKNLAIQYKFSNIEYSKITSINQIITIMTEYFYYTLFNEVYNDINPDNFKFDVVNFFENILNNNNINFIYENNTFNYLFKFESSLIYLMIYLKNNFIQNIDINDKIIVIQNITKLIKKYIIDIKNIDNFIYLKYIDNSDIDINFFNSNLYYVITNAVDKNMILNKLSNSINEFIYYINDYSYEKNISNIWTKYFKNYKIKFYYYNNNDFIIYETEFSIFNLLDIIKNYINTLIFKTKNFYKFILLSINDLYNDLFTYFDNNTIKDIDISLINSYFDFKLTDYKNFIYELLKINLKNNFSFVNYNIIENNLNLTFEFTIKNYCFYYYNLQNQINNYNIFNDIDNKIIFNTIGFKFIILLKIIDNLDNSSLYQNILLCYLNNSYEIIINNIKVINLNIRNNSVIYLDFINKNIIKNNNITNYYKNIQNNSLYDVIKYNINNFTNNINGYNSYFSNIYFNIISATNINSENNISFNFFFNLLNNFIRGYNENIIIYDNNSEIISNNYTIIINNINNYLELYKLGFGGNNTDNIMSFNQQKNIIFTPKNFKLGETVNTVYTLIYYYIKNIKEVNNLIIILFYFNCLTIWLSTNFKRKNNLQEIIYYFYNLIINNNNKFYKNQDLISINLFYDGLDDILYNNYNVDEFLNKINTFFTNILNNTFEQENYISSIDKLFNYNYNFNNKYDKSNVWKYLLGLVIDYNNSDFIKYLKSLINYIQDDIQTQYVDYIISLNNGIIDDYGIIKIIDHIDLLFDDEIIDNYYYSMFKIYIDLFQNSNKYPALKDMLGLQNKYNPLYNDNNIINGIKPFIKILTKKTYFIPLDFFFYNISNAIPLIASMHSSIQIKTYLNNTTIIKNSFITNNLSRNYYKFSLNSNFVIVERDQRLKICSKQIDNLIDKHNYYTLKKNIFGEDENFNNDDNYFIKFEFDIPSVVKEIFWNFNISSNNFNIFISDQEFFKNFIINTKFYIDGARRDGIIPNFGYQNYNKITNLLNIYKYNTNYPIDKEYNVYSFALNPEQFQPTGAINLNSYNTFTIEIQINKNYFINYLKDNNIVQLLKDYQITIHLNTLEYNFLRYQSGLSGLLFI